MIQMLHQRKNYFLAVFTTILLWGGSAMGQINTWDGSNGNLWNDPLNWSLNLVPIAAHDVVINLPAAITFSGKKQSPAVRNYNAYSLIIDKA